MVRGYQKRVVFLRSPDSRIFDEAYFVISEKSGQAVSTADMISEANRIIGENTARVAAPLPPKKAARGGAAFLAALAGFALGLTTGLLFALL